MLLRELKEHIENLLHDFIVVEGEFLVRYVREESSMPLWKKKQILEFIDRAHTSRVLLSELLEWMKEEGGV